MDRPIEFSHIYRQMHISSTLNKALRHFKVLIRQTVIYRWWVVDRKGRGRQTGVAWLSGVLRCIDKDRHRYNQKKYLKDGSLRFRQCVSGVYGYVQIWTEVSVDTKSFPMMTMEFYADRKLGSHNVTFMYDYTVKFCSLIFHIFANLLINQSTERRMRVKMIRMFSQYCYYLLDWIKQY